MSAVEAEHCEVLNALSREVGRRINARLTYEDFDTMAAAVAVAAIFPGFYDIVSDFKRNSWASDAYGRIAFLWEHKNDRDVVAATGEDRAYWYARYWNACKAVFARHGLDEYGCVPRGR